MRWYKVQEGTTVRVIVRLDSMDEGLLATIRL